MDIVSTLGNFGSLLANKKHLVPRPADTYDSIGLRLEQNAARIPNHNMLIFEDQELSWSEFNKLCNRYAHSIKAAGISKGDTVSLMMENRVEFLACTLAIHKLGATAALINTNLKGTQLTHCTTVTNSNLFIVGEECCTAVAGTLNETETENKAEIGYLFVSDKGELNCPDWARDLDALSQNASQDNPAETAQVQLGDNALYIFTSGTTGLPKAALLSHLKFTSSSTMAARAGFKCSEKDRIYICLPLYHATGLMIGFGAALQSGASIFLRRRFSGSRFLEEVRQYQTTCFIYIGEICRYLLSPAVKHNDADNPLNSIMGNGLRPDIWLEFKKRYGIKRVAEFYGSSEGNVAFANLLNKDCTIGMTTASIALVEYDVDNDTLVKNQDGSLIRVKKGQPGLLIGEINQLQRFEGYTNKEASEKKIIRDAFSKGDAWFDTGDLIREIDVGFAVGQVHYQFVDRLGDTYRWKSENVSTNEVGEIINQHPQVHLSNVYGVEVPHVDGRAGMATLILKPDCQQLDMDDLSQHISQHLTSYARPVFLRIQQQVDVTGTFKMLKGEARKQGFDIHQIEDPVFIMKPGSKHYELLDAEFLASINAGKAGF